MNVQLSRRGFIKLGAAGAVAVCLPGCRSAADRHATLPRQARLFFNSKGHCGLINADGTGLRYFDFDVPGQVSWFASLFFSDGQRVVFTSSEARRDGPGRPFDKYFRQTPKRVWIYDLVRDTLKEIATRERLGVHYSPGLLLDENRMLVQVLRDEGSPLVSMNLDGSDARDFIPAGEGLPYGLSLSPDGSRVAYHLASPQGYQIWTSDPDGTGRVRVAAHPDHLYFGTQWSPDGLWVVYQDCHFRTDPGHNWSDVCIGRADGSEHRVLTQGQVMWFAAAYGNPDNRGGGSNRPDWTRDGQILFPRRLPASKTAWEFQPQRPDTDHFNRDYKPELARGGAEIIKLNPVDGTALQLTRNEPPVWDFRASPSPDGRFIAFCRAETGGSPSVWVMDADGRNQRLLTRGFEDKGADHPRWMPEPASPRMEPRLASLVHIRHIREN